MHPLPRTLTEDKGQQAHTKKVQQEKTPASSQGFPLEPSKTFRKVCET